VGEVAKGGRRERKKVPYLPWKEQKQGNLSSYPFFFFPLSPSLPVGALQGGGERTQSEDVKGADGDDRRFAAAST
jgi:hypothetical protein